MKFKIQSEIKVIGLVGIPMIIMIIYSFLTILYTQKIAKEECNKLAELMYSEQIDFSKQLNSAVAFQVNKQVQNVQWNIYLTNQLLKKILDGKVQQSPNFSDILIHVERTYNNTEDEFKLDIFHRNYLLETSWFVKGKSRLEELDSTQKDQLRNMTSLNVLMRPILLERDIAAKKNKTRRFYIKNMYLGTQYDGMVNGPAANTTYRYIRNPPNCASGRDTYDSRCRYWFGGSLKPPSKSMVMFPPSLQYSDLGIPFLASVLCQRVERPPFNLLNEQYETISQQGTLYSVLCNNLDLTSAEKYFSNFNKKSAFNMLIDPITQNAIYFSQYKLDNEQSFNITALEFNQMTTKDQTQFFQDQLKNLYRKNIQEVKKSLDMLQLIDINSQLGFKYMRLNNPQNQFEQNNTNSSNSTYSFEQQIDDEEKYKNLKEHYVILNAVQVIDKLKEPWKEGYILKNAFVLIDVLSRDLLSTAAQKMLEEINYFFYVSFILKTIFFAIVIIAVFLRFIRIFKLIIRPIKQLTNLLNDIKLDDENQIFEIFGNNKMALKSLSSEDLFLSEDTRILYDSFVSLFSMLQFTQQNIFTEAESQTLLNFNESILHFEKFKNYKALGIIHNNLGFIHSNAMRYEEALREYSKAIIYANYEIKFYEEEIDEDQQVIDQSTKKISNSSDQKRNMTIAKNYKELILESKKKCSSFSGSKIFNSGSNSFLKQKKQQCKNQIGKKSSQKIINQDHENQSEFSIQQNESKKLTISQNDNIKKNKSISDGRTMISPNIRRKSPKQINIEEVRRQTIIKKNNSQSSSNSPPLNKRQNSQEKIQSFTQQRSPQKSIIKLERQSSIKKQIKCQIEKDVNQQNSVNSQKIIKTRRETIDNEYFSLFSTLYARKFNYAKTMLNILENKSVPQIQNMWSELEQLLLEIREIGEQITLPIIKGGQLNCLLILVKISQKINNNQKLKFYLKQAENLLSEILQENISSDILHEQQIQSNTTLKYNKKLNEQTFYNNDILKNRDYIINYLQNLLTNSSNSDQPLIQDDQNKTNQNEGEQIFNSLIQKYGQEYTAQLKDLKQNKNQIMNTTQDKSTLLNQTCTAFDLKKSFFSNQNQVLNQTQQQIFQNLSNSSIRFGDPKQKSSLSPQRELSPYEIKGRQNKKKMQTLNIVVQKNQYNQQPQQNSKVFDENGKKQPSYDQNSPEYQFQGQSMTKQIKNQRNKPIIQKLICAQQSTKKDQYSPKKYIRKSSRNTINVKVKSRVSLYSVKSTSKKEKSTTKLKSQSQLDLDLQFKQQMQLKLQKRMKRIKQELKQVSNNQVKMPYLNQQNQYRNIQNFMHPDLIVSRMHSLISSILISQGKLYESALILTSCFENQYYFDPSVKHNQILLLSSIFKKAQIQIPPILKQMQSCFNKSINYKIGIVSLCTSKFNRLKAYLLIKQILSLILTKPDDEFNLITYKSNYFYQIIQNMNIKDMSKQKNIIENSLLQIYKDKVEQINEPKLKSKTNLNCSNNNKFKIIINNTDNIPPTPSSSIHQIRVQKKPMLIKNQSFDNSQIQLLNNQNIQQSFDNSKSQNKDMNKSTCHLAQPTQVLNTDINNSFLNSSYLQPNQYKQNNLTEDKSPVTNRSNQTLTLIIPSTQQLNNVRTNIINETITSNKNVSHKKQNSPLKQTSFTNLITFQDQDIKKKEFISLNDIDEIQKNDDKNQKNNEKTKIRIQTNKRIKKKNSGIQSFQEFENTLTNSQITQNYQILFEQINLQKQDNNYDNSSSENNTSEQNSNQSYQYSSENHINNDDNESNSNGIIANEFYTIQDIDEEIISEQLTNINNNNFMNGHISPDHAFHYGIKKTIINSFYSGNQNHLFSQMNTQDKIKKDNKQTQQNDNQLDIYNLNKFCINKYIICIIDSPDIPCKNEKYEQLCKYLYNINVELLILQLDQSTQIYEQNYPQNEYFNDKQIISIFYSEQKLLQYLYNNRQSQNVYTIPLIVEYFQTNYLFVITF